MVERKTHFDVIVIGAGSSGMMAAGTAAARGRSVLVLEKNAVPGAKLDLTGGGRCNITNATENVRELLSHYGPAAKYLFSPFSQFGMKDTFSFFESRRVPLMVEARERAFPRSQNAHDVTRALIDFMREHDVTLKVKSPVTGLVAPHGHIREVITPEGRYTAESVIIATGGTSHPETGSTGDGFAWIRELGHTVTDPSPSVVPLRVREKWVHALSGTSLSFMKISFLADGKRAFSKTGKLLFTHFGISGPLVLNSSKQVADLMAQGSVVTALIDMYPDTDFADVEKKILNAIDANKNKDFRNLFDDIVPHGLQTVIEQMLALPDPHVKAHSLTKEDRRRLVHILKGAPITIEGLMGLDRAVISDGGVSLDEVDTRTMRSRLVSNLFLTGDILNINRPSGGFSLQLCWTTGYVAGINA